MKFNGNHLYVIWPYLTDVQLLPYQKCSVDACLFCLLMQIPVLNIEQSSNVYHCVKDIALDGGVSHPPAVIK